MAGINGIEYSWSSIKVAMLGNISVEGVKSLNYKVDRESENVYGAGGKPVAIGYGNYTYEGEIQLHQSEIMKIRKATGSSLVDIPPFDIIVSFATTPTGPRTIHKLIGCAFRSDGVSASSGDKEMPMTIPLTIRDIQF